MAKLEAFDSQDAIPEPLRDYYIEQDGKWVPDAPGLHSALTGERQQRANAVRRAEAAERKAQDLEGRLQSLETKLEERGAAAGGDGSEGNKSAIERLERDFKERLKQFEAQLAAERERRESAERERDESGLSDYLRTSLLEENVPKGAIEDLIALPRFRNPWKKTETGYAPYEGDAPRLDPENPSKHMSGRAYAKEYLKANPHWLPPSNGGGANGSSNVQRGGIITVSREELRDAANYARIQEQAAKTGATIQYTDT